MRKIITIIMTICMTLAFAVHASAQTDAEILFRGIPWESDIVTFVTAVSDDLTGLGAQFSYDIESSADTLVMFEGYSDASDAHTDYYYPTAPVFEAVYTIDKSTFTVADVETNSIWLYAIPEVVDGSPMEGQENTDLVLAKYVMRLESYSDKTAVYDAICEKMKQLYGEPDETQSYMMLWYGTNDTFCSIVQFNDGALNINYGKTDLPERMEPLQHSSDDIDSSDMGGL